jgi:hypothetical protein
MMPPAGEQEVTRRVAVPLRELAVHGGADTDLEKLRRIVGPGARSLAPRMRLVGSRPTAIWADGT